jgi:hypothetical protein
MPERAIPLVLNSLNSLVLITEQANAMFNARRPHTYSPPHR